MQIHYDAKGHETIKFTVNESRKMQSTFKLLDALGRARGDGELRQAIEIVKKRVPLVAINGDGEEELEKPF